MRVSPPSLTAFLPTSGPRLASTTDTETVKRQACNGNLRHRKEVKMHTFDFVARHPLRALGALSALIAAVAVAVGSSASFTATSANPSNTFAAGTLSILNSKEGLAVLTASGMKPGDSETGTVDVQNSGSLSGAFVLSRSNIVDSDAVHPMSAKLDLVVKDCGDFSSGTPTCDVGDPVKYTGTIAAMGSTALGTFAAAEKHRYQFAVTFNSSADNFYQGDNSSVEFDWDAS
jgi:spore coat-associated protein N